MSDLLIIWRTRSREMARLLPTATKERRRRNCLSTWSRVTFWQIIGFFLLSHTQAAKTTACRSGLVTRAILCLFPRNIVTNAYGILERKEQFFWGGEARNRGCVLPKYTQEVAGLLKCLLGLWKRIPQLVTRGLPIFRKGVFGS
jgi:hypothetical protein